MFFVKASASRLSVIGPSKTFKPTIETRVVIFRNISSLHATQHICRGEEVNLTKLSKCS